MLKYINNNRGVALLTVMSIMTALVLVGSLMLYMASSESRVVYDYSNNNRAFYIAEAGADLAIEKWKEYVTSNNNDKSFIADASTFTSKYPISLNSLKTNFENNYNTSLVGNYTTTWSPSSGSINSGDLLTLTVTGSYDQTTYEQRVQLWYYRKGDDSQWVIDSYKGAGSANVIIPVVEVSLQPSLTLTGIGATSTLVATVSPSNATNKNITWSSEDTGIATVDNGVVTATGIGTTTITATADGKTATCIVIVNDSIVPVNDVKLDTPTLTLTAGGARYQLTATVSPSNATNKAVTWNSSKPSVATVSSTGLVSPVAKGTAIITVKTDDGGKTDTCTVTVLDPNIVVGGSPIVFTGPAVLDNIIDTTSITATDLYVTGYVDVKNNGFLNVGPANVLSVGTDFTAENNSGTTINNVQNVAIGQDFTVLNNADTTISNVQAFTVGSNMNLSNNGQVDFTGVNTIRIGGDFSLDNNGEVNFNNVDTLIIEGDFTIANNTTVTFRNTPKVIIKGNLTLSNNSNLKISQGGTEITLYGTYNTTSNFQVASGSTLKIYDESAPPVLLFKIP